MGLRGVLLAALAAGARAWTAADLPDPQTSPEACGRETTGWICSPDALVSGESLNVLEGTVRHIYAGKEPYTKLTCPDNGDAVPAEVLVAVVRRVDGRGDAERKVEAFARGLHNRFGVGTCGSGVVLALSVEDRHVYISVGALAKQRLSPRRIEGVVDAMRPLLREGAYGTALEHALVQIGLILSGPAGAERARKQQEAAAPDDPWWWSWAPVGLFASVFGFAGARQWRQRRRRSAATRELRRLQRDLQATRAGRYVATSCPICFNDFAKPPGSGKGATDAAEAARGDAGASTSAATEEEPLLKSSAVPDGGAGLRQRSGGSREASDEESAATGGADAAAEGGGREPFLLPCGHSFCEPCITKWLAGNPQCPICRKPVGPGDGADRPPPAAEPRARPPRRRPPPPPHHTGACHAAAPGLGDAELAFRLWQLHQLYPSVVTSGMVTDMTASAAAGGDLTWETHADYVAQTAEGARQEHAAWGSSNTGASFGGGGGSSGGGGGGW